MSTLGIDSVKAKPQAGKPVGVSTPRSESRNNCSKVQNDEKTNDDIKHYQKMIEYYTAKKNELLSSLETGKYTEMQRISAAEAKHSTAKWISYSGLGVCGAGMSVGILGFANPYTLIGGIAVGLVGAAVGCSAKAYINNKAKNLTKEEMKEYVQSEINKLDNKIAEYQEKLNELGVVKEQLA